MDEKRERISGLTAGGLIYAAVLIDLFKLMLDALGIIPVVGLIGPVISIFVGLISSLAFFLFYLHLGVELTERVFVKGLGYLFAIFFPFATTFATALTIYFVRRDDRAYNEEKST